MHPRNSHTRYNFKKLIEFNQELGKYVKNNKFGISSIDFSHPEAVKCLNQTILYMDYGIKHWSIPALYLCPPIPGRADYIHYIADLLGNQIEKDIPRGKKIKGLDIGTGANCIYPLLGHALYDWSFVGSEIDPISVSSAELNVKNNQLNSCIEIRQQPDPQYLLKNIITKNDLYSFSMANPPFHSSPDEAMKGTMRKWKGLGKQKETSLNFGGRPNELWCEGGEKQFISRLAEEAQEYSNQILWFTSLVSKETNLPFITKKLDNLKVNEWKILDMNQGQKKSRMVAWTYLPISDRTLFLKKAKS